MTTQMTKTMTYEQMEEAILDYLHARGDLPIMEGPVSLDIPMSLNANGLIELGMDIVGTWEPEEAAVIAEQDDAGLLRFIGAPFAGAEVISLPANA